MIFFILNKFLSQIWMNWSIAWWLKVVEYWIGKWRNDWLDESGYSGHRKAVLRALLSRLSLCIYNNPWLIYVYKTTLVWYVYINANWKVLIISPTQTRLDETRIFYTPDVHSHSRMNFFLPHILWLPIWNACID